MVTKLHSRCIETFKFRFLSSVVSKICFANAAPVTLHKTGSLLEQSMARQTKEKFKDGKFVCHGLKIERFPRSAEN